jgi:UPF0042 nucleotide-binding protein
MNDEAREIILVTGTSGSGKSVALHALEDAGYFCIDNLPPQLVRDALMLERQQHEARQLAIGVDVRSAALPALMPLLDDLKREGVRARSVFLDASTDALLRRFSETRRPHPLARDGGALTDAIERERELLGALREVSTVIDTSDLRPAQLRAWMRELVGAGGGALTLVFESFAYRHGVPRDADLVFDLRVLPNPHYVRELRALTGRDGPVAAFLDAQAEAVELLGQIESFVQRWLPAYEADQRGYLTVALGCTGGQHRSVYAAQTLAARFAAVGRAALVRHRELDTQFSDSVF